MNQGFKLRFDQLRESDPTEPVDEAGVGLVEQPGSSGYSRNVCFVWPDGRRAFFNYAYLINGEYEPNGETNVIRLNFSSRSVILLGYRLQPLYMALFDHLPRIVTAIEPRYVLEEERHTSIVIGITLEN